MGLTQRLGTIPLAIQTDSSNNVGIGANPISSTKFYVLGNTTNYGITSENPSGYGGLTLKQISGNSWSLGVTSNNLFFYDANGGATRMTLTGAGNVGIGTSSPQSFLEVKGANPFIRITDSVGSGDYGFIMDAGGGFIRGGLTINSSTGEYKSFCGVAGNSYFQTFLVNGSERMRITTGGDVLIGTTTGTKLSGGVSMLQVSGAGGGGQINISGGYTPDAALNVRDFSNNYISFFYGNTKTGSVTTNGSTTAYNTTSSDRELKKNFEDWNENVLDIFKNSNPQLFNFKTEDDDALKTKGFIAQELYDYFPEAYPIGQDEKHLFNPSGMVIYLMKALKDAAVKIDELSAKVTALENK